jgi:hypothetical protein
MRYVAFAHMWRWTTKLLALSHLRKS